jgi:hypothetical protein
VNECGHLITHRLASARRQDSEHVALIKHGFYDLCLAGPERWMPPIPLQYRLGVVYFYIFLDSHRKLFIKSLRKVLLRSFNRFKK